MSLVNNSANNFKDFLDAIKPYLNYQFYDLSGQGVEANNFSTDEKVIGTWIDGKPLYQKTVDCGALPNNTYTQTEHNISNLDKIVFINGVVFKNDSSKEAKPAVFASTTNFASNITVDTDKDYIWLSAGTNRTEFHGYVTLRYTKTTDTAVASGEKIVGQWIDGKPVYEKVYVLENTLNISNSSFTNTGISASNIDIILKCTCVDGNGSMSDNNMANTYGNGSAHTEVAIQTSRNSTGISINKIILRYTKTTD